MNRGSEPAADAAGSEQEPEVEEPGSVQTVGESDRSVLGWGQWAVRLLAGRRTPPTSVRKPTRQPTG